MQIDTNIPMPSRSSANRKNPYPFGDLRIGDSFARPRSEHAILKTRASRYKGQHPGWNYETRIVGEMIRLWRVAPPEPEGEPE